MTAPAATRLPLTRNPRFLRLWAAETISHFGSSITGIALPFVAITLLQAGPLEVAVINLADFLPFLLIGLLAGALVDRLPRRPRAAPASPRKRRRQRRLAGGQDPL